MRLVVDLQACQTDSRDRGIGRYAMSLVQAIVSALDRKDELVVAIDLADPDRAQDVRNELRCRGVLAKVVGYEYPTTQCTDASPAARLLTGQLRSRFFESLSPDVLLISSLFETGLRWSTELDWEVLSHVATAVIGYDLIPLLFAQRYLPEGHFVTDWYRARLEDLRKFDLVLSISEATKRDLVNLLGIEEARIDVIGAGFDETLTRHGGKAAAQCGLEELGITKPFVLMVGNGDWRKNTLGALRAFAMLPESLRHSHELVLTQVGDDVSDALAREYSHLRGSVRVLGRVDDATLALLYAQCRVFYFPSHYEGFGLPVLEAMAFDAPVLTSNAGALPEVVHDPRVLFDPDSPKQGVALLTQALTDPHWREGIRQGARQHALTFTWERTARAALQAIRTLVERKGAGDKVAAADAQAWPQPRDILLMADAWIESGESGGHALEDGLRAVARTGSRRVLVDITEIIRLDARTGIQRVTREFFGGLASIAREKSGFEVEPFCWTEHGIHYAREYARSQLGVPCAGQDEPLRVWPSDLVFMLDSSWWLPERFDDFHERARLAGGEVVWMVHDLIPIRFPETCEPGMDEAYGMWLNRAVHEADGFICNSDATRADLEAFMDEKLEAGIRRPWTRSVHLGCDISLSSADEPSDKGALLRNAIGQRRYFVALGTIEPRKDYPTILAAFERLWRDGVDVVLVVIGKQGWNVETLVARIGQHPEFGRRLHWLQGGSDGDVRHLLKDSSGLIQASIWEGFGLPLIEAGYLGIPLLVSDIAVFHEIAGDGATYFPVGDAVSLAYAIDTTVKGYPSRGHTSIRLRDWKQASRELADVLLVA